MFLKISQYSQESTCVGDSFSLIKKRPQHRCIPVNIAKFLRTTFFTDRSSCPEVFCKKGVLRNFAKLTGKHLCQNLFFNKVAGLRPATLLKISLWHKYFSVNFPKFLRTPFLTKHLRWLLLRGSIMDSLLESFLIVESCINN